VRCLQVALLHCLWQTSTPGSVGPSVPRRLAPVFPIMHEVDCRPATEGGPSGTGKTPETLTNAAQGFADSPQSDQADLTYPWRAFINRTAALGLLTVVESQEFRRPAVLQ